MRCQIGDRGMSDYSTLAMNKAIVWNEAKGKLRALSDLEGHRSMVDPTCAVTDNGFGEKWVLLRERIENFIEEIENEGLSE